MGPPLSPLHESLPPAARPAQNMLVVTAELPYSDWHDEREMTGTETLRRVEGRDEPPSLVRPLCNVSEVFQQQEVDHTYQPAVVTVVPAAGSDP